MFIWGLVCLRELKKIAFFTIGLWSPLVVGDSVWNRSKSRIDLQSAKLVYVKGEAKLKKMTVYFSWKRALILTVTCSLVRFAIALSLCYIGMLFLMATLEVEELILNAFTLEAVLRIDDLIFEVLAPTDCIQIVKDAVPLRVPRFHGWRRRLVPWIKVMSVLAVLAVAMSFKLAPAVRAMADAQNTLCGGDTSFTAIEMIGGEVVTAALQRLSVDQNSLRYRAIFQRTGLEQHKHDPIYFEGHPFATESIATLQAWEKRTWTSMAEPPIAPEVDLMVFKCVDDTRTSMFDAERAAEHMVSLHSATWSLMADKTHNRSVETCGDVEFFCSDASDIGRAVRLTCPVTCGAASVRSGLFYTSPADGVPSDCDTALDSELMQDLCFEEHHSDIVKSAAWKRYADAVASDSMLGWEHAAGGNATHLQRIVDQWYGGMSRGCPFFSESVAVEHLDGHIEYVDFCDVQVDRFRRARSARFLCPITCRCRTEGEKFVAAELVARALDPSRWKKDPTPATFRSYQCPACCFYDPGIAVMSPLIEEQGLQCINRRLEPGELAVLQQTTSTGPVL
eukprot:TRINITY_DN12945_c0_g7_i1.p1 TRINITY_DN12945_c0_g7~~TRINITY_DN12945_c0_g7_i1.p1  ORF type:complete len:645 (+),score=67.13 TRINITY_DN12945_c0_g7_i1:244-1935(+)